MAQVHDDDELMLITQQGKILRMASRDIRTIGRATQGVRLIDIEGDDRTVSIARLAEKDEDAANGTARGAPSRQRRAAPPRAAPDAGGIAAEAAALGVACAARLTCAWRPSPCGVLSPEEQLLTDFFEASRLFDTSVMARLSAAPLNPRTDGIIDSFEIERRGPLERSDSERVTVAARVRTFDGQVSSRQSGVHADAPGWPLVHSGVAQAPRKGAPDVLSGHAFQACLTRLRASRTSRAASSAPPRRTSRSAWCRRPAARR